MQTWFITGASRGFGALVAKLALGKGDAVVATARNPQSVTAALGEHPNLLAVALDVTNEAQAHEAAKAAIQRFGKIDVLLNNAGFGLLGAVEEATIAATAAVATDQGSAVDDDCRAGAIAVVATAATTTGGNGQDSVATAGAIRTARGAAGAP